MTKKILLIVGAIVLSLAIAGYLYLQKTKVADQNTAVEEATQALEDITATPELNISTNPLENKLPELNPIEKTNPFNVYQNPFQ